MRHAPFDTRLTHPETGMSVSLLTVPLALFAVVAIAIRTAAHPFVQLTAGSAVATVLLAGLVTRTVLGRCGCLHLTRWDAGALLLTAATGLVAWSKVPTNSDVDLYHHQAIIMQTVGDVPAGMANVHDRLGLVSGIHPLGALLEVPGGGNGSRLAVSAVVLLALLALTDSVRRMRHGTPTSADLARVSAIALLMSHGLMEPSYWLSSPSPDLPFALTSVVASTAGLSVFNARKSEDVDHESRVLIIFVVLAVWLRPLALVVLPVVIVGLAWNRVLPSVRLVLAASTALAVRFLYSLYASGHPLFPVAIPGWKPPWSVSLESAASTSALVRGWARLPGGDPAAVLADWSWIEWWWSYHGPRLWIIALLLVISAVVMLLRTRAATRKHDLVTFALLFVPVIAWFLTAPDPRFALGYLILPPLFLLARAFRAERMSLKRLWATRNFVNCGAIVLVAVSLMIGVIQSAPSETLTAIPATSEMLDEPAVWVPEDGRCQRTLWCNPQHVVVVSSSKIGPIDYLSIADEGRP
jgi:hypothetical protein